MITNIKDKRDNSNKSTNLDFVIEPSCHDNDMHEAAQHDTNDPRITTNYAELLDASISEGIVWGSSFDFPVTLFVYTDLHFKNEPHKADFLNYLDPSWLKDE